MQLNDKTPFKVKMYCINFSVLIFHREKLFIDSKQVSDIITDMFQ